MSEDKVMLGLVNSFYNRCVGKKKEFGLQGTHGRRLRIQETEVGMTVKQGPIGSAATMSGWKEQGGVLC